MEVEILYGFIFNDEKVSIEVMVKSAVNVEVEILHGWISSQVWRLKIFRAESVMMWRFKIITAE